MRDAVDWFAVFSAALLTALATGLGALPFAVKHGAMPPLFASANALAGGVMLGASAGLALEGLDRSELRTAIGVLAGVLFVGMASRTLDGSHALTLGSLTGAAARKAILIVGVMFAHSAAEGVGVGAAFGDGAAFGVLIAVAIAVQNIPEGVAISLVLVKRGTRVRTAAGWSIFSSLPQPLLAVPAFLFVEQFKAALPAGLGFAAGAMTLMVARELLPDALTEAPRRVVALDVAVGFVLMLVMQIVLSA